MFAGAGNRDAITKRISFASSISKTGNGKDKDAPEEADCRPSAKPMMIRTEDFLNEEAGIGPVKVPRE